MMHSHFLYLRHLYTHTGVGTHTSMNVTHECFEILPQISCTIQNTQNYTHKLPARPLTSPTPLPWDEIFIQQGACSNMASQRGLGHVKTDHTQDLARNGHWGSLNVSGVPGWGVKVHHLMSLSVSVKGSV